MDLWCYEREQGASVGTPGVRAEWKFLFEQEKAMFRRGRTHECVRSTS